ncbi:MAG: autoinducer binding domain-containing protein [Gallionellaceae bacterium]|nr:autoinducer binding domain-containing protein [Gallionellaceae bacterium]
MIDFALFESLLKCDTVEQLHAQTTLITQQMGFQHFIYGAELNNALTPPYKFILSGYPEEWWKHYCVVDYQQIDPVVRHSMQRVTPLTWTDLKDLRPDAQRLMDEAKDFNLVNGATFPLHGMGGGFGLFSVAVDRDTKQTRKDIVHHLSQAQLLANYLHESVYRIVLGKDIHTIERVYFKKLNLITP